MDQSASDAARHARRAMSGRIVGHNEGAGAVVSDEDTAGQPDASIKVAVTAAGRVGASRLDVECARCGASERRYVPRGTVRVAHACGGGWQVMTEDLSVAIG